jgi:hypothetical protein
LTEAAVENNLDPELWNERGYYLVENGEHLWVDLARLMGKKTIELGLIEGKLEDKTLSMNKATEQAGMEGASWGFNSRGKAERATKVVNWLPTGPSIEDCVEEILWDEKSRLERKQHD